MYSAFPICESAFCSRLDCWRSIGWAAIFRRRALTPISWRSSSTRIVAASWAFIDLFSGGQLRRLTIFALGIMPYITASIILQLMTVVYEPLAKLQKEGELGRKKITQWTRYLTLGLSAVQSLGIAFTLQRQPDFVLNPGIGFVLMTMLTLTTGSVFIMWLGEQITERGVGNGMSLLIFAGIVVGLPRGVMDMLEKAESQAWGAFTVPAMLLLVVLMVAVVAFIVFVERSERRIPVQYAKRVVGRKIMGGQSTHLPLRVNSGGVMPVIFRLVGADIATDRRSAVQGTTATSARCCARCMGRAALHPAVCGGHYLLRLLLRVDRLQPDRGCRQHAQVRRVYSWHSTGRANGELHQRHSDAHHAGRCAVPDSDLVYSGVDDRRYPPQSPFGSPIGTFFERMPAWVTNGLGVNFYFGGTSLLIVVGVAMDTINQVESQLVMRHYEGFTPRSGRVRGRRATW